MLFQTIQKSIIQIYQKITHNILIIDYGQILKTMYNLGNKNTPIIGELDLFLYIRGLFIIYSLTLSWFQILFLNSQLLKQPHF
ncbi:unnamed protein product [Paramecium octaurelia]|uniref:Transmembrane protein n=1 Tax=Paramecium octaurelia TaxID=43137 RepID=A0A8S1V4Z3_PAROT|nr:unnamed protein product [Paramecium octaurelia]CAD8170972.1 unnamed protein product [Paramecium octaurelia]